MVQIKTRLCSLGCPLYSLKAVLFLLGVLVLSACSQNKEIRQESYVFGTRVEIVSYGVSSEKAQAGLGEAMRELDRLHHAYHAWQPSQLTILNNALAQGRAVTVSPEMLGLLASSREYSKMSDGLFDPAIGHLIRLWGFQSDQFDAKLPPQADIARLLALHPRSTDLQMNGLSVSTENRAVSFDFGGIVKGYALDRAAQILRKKGINNALINIGGNVMALGKKGDVPWTVGIQNPRASGSLASLALYDGEAIGTSGDYQRFFEVDGKRYCHLIDPRTGRPSAATESITVLITPAVKISAPFNGAGILSDVMSKPLFIAGDNWAEQARQLHISYVLRVDAKGKVTVSHAMRERLHWEKGVVPAQIVQL